ncbi:ICK kinase, partial [Upupa epops]|nr:ICK kinase [Upupa epops]
YRAPEVLLRSTSYSSPIDIWAVGCIMAEVYTLRPLFPGASEIDTIFKICQVLGTPKQNDWPEGYQLSASMNFRWPQCVPNNLKTLIPNASSEAVQLMRDMLQWDPKKRPTASQALRYPYFQVGHALGIQELTKRKEMHNKSSLHIKPVPPAQPPPKPHAHISSRPFQQSSQHLVYLSKTDNSSAEHAHCLQKDTVNQVLLPAIYNKVPQQKTSAGTETISGGLKPKTRRRWGHLARPVKSSEVWDDLEDPDFGSSITKVDLKNKKQSDETLSRFESILNLKPSDAVGSGSSAPFFATFPQQDTPMARVSAAKQHYLRHSRYLPGISTQKSTVSTSSKETAPSNPWSSSGLSGKVSGLGGSMNHMNSGPIGSGGLTSGCIPSSQKKEVGSAGQRVHLTPAVDPASNCASLKSARPHIGQPTFSSPTKSTPRLMPFPPPAQPVHGRVDWSAKYGAHR